MDIRRIIRCSSCGRKLGIYCGGDLKLEIKCYRCKKICVYKFRSVYKELHADHETGATDNK